MDCGNTAMLVEFPQEYMNIKRSSAREYPNMMKAMLEMGFEPPLVRQKFGKTCRVIVDFKVVMVGQLLQSNYYRTYQSVFPLWFSTLVLWMVSRTAWTVEASSTFTCWPETPPWDLIAPGVRSFNENLISWLAILTCWGGEVGLIFASPKPDDQAVITRICLAHRP
jgi:hypothetical protein